MSRVQMRVSPPLATSSTALDDAPSIAASPSAIKPRGTRETRRFSRFGVAFVLITQFIFGRKRKRATPPGKAVPMTPHVDMEPGGSYLLPSDKPDFAFKLLTRELRKGASGMIITRLHPQEVRARFDIGSASVHWLSRAFTKDSVSPTNLGAMADEIAAFVGKNNNPVILLDGIEYLIVQNDLQKVVRFVSTVRDCVAMNKARLVIPFNMQSVDESGRALLTRDLHVIRWNG